LAIRRRSTAHARIVIIVVIVIIIIVEKQTQTRKEACILKNASKISSQTSSFLWGRSLLERSNQILRTLFSLCFVAIIKKKKTITSI